MKSYRSLGSCIVSVLIICGGCPPLVQSAGATSATWSGSFNSVFSTGSNWLGNAAPTNSSSTGTAAFAGTVTTTTNQPNLTGNYSLNLLTFTTATGGWVLSGNGSSVLTIGAGGIDASLQTSGYTNISAPVAASTTEAWRVGTSGTLEISGSTSSTGAVTIGATGALGTIILSGSSSRSGGTAFYGGTLVLGDDNALGTGVFTMPSTSSGAAAVLKSTTSGTRTIANNVTVSDSSLTIAGPSDFLFTGTVSANQSSDVITVNNKTEFSALAGTLPANGFVIAGTGTAVLSGAGTYTGTTRVEGGRLEIGAGGTSGSLSSNVLSTGVGSGGVVAFNRSDAYTYSGSIVGVGQIQQIGSGVTTLTGPATYSGVTTISNGALQANSGAGLSGSSYLKLDGGVLQSNGAASFTRNLSATASGASFEWTANGGGFSANGGQMTVNIGNALAEQTWGSTPGSNIVGTLKFGSSTANNTTLFENGINLNAADRTIDVAQGAGGDSANISGVIRTSSGTAGLIKTGNGALMLSAANTYNGSTVISAGTLLLSAATNNITGSQTINVNSGATFDVSGVSGFTLATGQTLTGAGTVNGALTVGIGATLFPGSTPGTMTFNNNLSLAAGSNSTFQINGLTSGLYDLALGAGGTQTVVFNGVLNLDFSSGFNTTGSVQIFNFGMYSGSFQGGVSVTGLASGYTATFDSTTGDVTIAVVPEPSSVALLLGGCAITVILVRRRLVLSQV